jgi:predicted nucleic acid-binding protein
LNDKRVVIVDTTVWIDYLRGNQNAETKWLERELQLRRLGLTDLILCEVLQGIREQGVFGRVQRELLRFEVFDTGGGQMAVAAAANYRELHQHGYTVYKTIDCLIATFCLRGGHELLHRDRDFDCFEKFLGLRVVHAN